MMMQLKLRKISNKMKIVKIKIIKNNNKINNSKNQNKKMNLNKRLQIKKKLQ